MLILSDDQMINMALCGCQKIRLNRLQTLEEQYNLGTNLYNKISKSKNKPVRGPATQDSRWQTEEIESLQVLIELLWLQSPNHGLFKTYNSLKDNMSNRSNDHRSTTWNNV